MSLTTQTFNHKALMRIAFVMAFIQFTNALEYMALTPVFAFMADGFSAGILCWLCLGDVHAGCGHFWDYCVLLHPSV